LSHFCSGINQKTPTEFWTKEEHKLALMKDYEYGGSTNLVFLSVTTTCVLTAANKCL